MNFKRSADRPPGRALAAESHLAGLPIVIPNDGPENKPMLLDAYKSDRP
jgi:hypothetical protein